MDYRNVEQVVVQYEVCYDIISMETFIAVQIEKERRSGIDMNTGKRKTTRYNSQNVLGGLLVCSECGRNYRRYTRVSGEVVWRCVNRIEYGKKVCHYSPTLSEVEVIHYLCELLDMKIYDPQNVKEQIESIVIDANKCLTPQFNKDSSAENKMEFILG